MKRLHIIVFMVIFSLSITKITIAGNIPRADAVTFLGMEQVAQELKKVVFAVQVEGNLSNEDKDDDWVYFGTGFLVKTTQKRTLGITCRHVITAVQKTKKQLYIGIDIEKGYRRFPCKILHIDSIYDVAILEAKKEPKEIVKVKSLTIPLEMFDDNNSIIEGRGVLMPGYPLALGIEDDKNHPVVRFGIVAQYPGKDHFLIDGFASHGNSGSPVFLLKHKDQKLIGMITSHVTDHITLFDEHGRLSGKFPYNSGLARAISAKVIKELLDKISK